MSARRLVRNPLHGEPATAPADTAVLAFHRSFPGYAATPLTQLPAVAARLGVGSVAVKDESARLGSSSFKMLGASWATCRRLCELLGIDHHSQPLTLADLRARLASLRPLELVAATDGNHGLAVAQLAAMLSLGAHILVPANLSAARIAALRAEGAAVTVIPGDYDEAVATMAGLADERHVVVSDTSWPGYVDVPRWVADGYSTLFAELDEQLLAEPTLVAVQVGVGAFASAAVSHFHNRSRLLGVEPTTAACVLASVEAGEPVTVPGPHDSVMAGLNCGTPSLVAWPIVSAGLDLLATVDDTDAVLATRLLASCGVSTAETGAAGLAGVLTFAGQLELGADDHVLVVVTEASSPGHTSCTAASR